MGVGTARTRQQLRGARAMAEAYRPSSVAVFAADHRVPVVEFGSLVLQTVMDDDGWRHDDHSVVAESQHGHSVREIAVGRNENYGSWSRIVPAKLHHINCTQ